MVRPLSKYIRPPEIQAALEAALQEERAALVARARQPDRRKTDYLPSECLVYLIRGAIQTGDAEVFNELLPILLERCGRNLQRTVLPIPELRGLADDILGKFVALFVEKKKPQRLDFFEVRFNRAFKRFRDNCVEAELRLLWTRQVPVVDDDLPPQSLLFHREDYDPEQRMAIKEALAALPKAERNAFILCKVMGIKAESNDPNEVTAATLCGVSGRSIRNYLARAEEILSFLEEDA